MKKNNTNARVGKMEKIKTNAGGRKKNKSNVLTEKWRKINLMLDENEKK